MHFSILGGHILKYKKIVVRFLINHFLCCTRFFYVKRILLNFAGIKTGKNSKIVGPIFFGNNIEISIGNNCWIGKNISFDGDGKILIKNNIDIAPNVTINTGGHKIGSNFRRAGVGIKNTIIIEDGCWIGTNVLIINNVLIEKGVVVAAGSVVIRDVEKDTLIAGVPARVKRRLTND